MKTCDSENFNKFDIKLLQNNPKTDKENREGTFKGEQIKWIFRKINGGGQE